MNYIYKLLIIILILYILYNCFRTREGLTLNNSKNGKLLRNKILLLLGSINNNRININDYDYNTSNLCKTNNYYYYTPDSNYIQDCKNNLTKIKSISEYKDLPNSGDINIHTNKSMSIDSLVNAMNCHVLSKTMGNPTLYNKDTITENEIQDSYSENKYTLNEHLILGSYNSSCVYLDNNTDTHDLSQVSLLFNLGVRYFDFNIVNKDNSYYVVSPLTDNGLSVSDIDNDTLKLNDIISTISDNIKEPLYSRNFSDLQKSIQPGSINNNDPLFINLNICIKNYSTNHFNNIYNIITNKIPIEKFYTDISVFNIYNKTKKNNFLSVPIDKFARKIILLVDIYSPSIKFNSESINLSPLFNSFIKSDLAKITSMLVNKNKDSNLLKGLKKNQELLNFKSVVKESTSEYSMSKDENEFRILEPEYSIKCLKRHKNNTYLCNGSDYVKNGVNVVCYPFYVLSSNDKETNDKFLDYYLCFNNPSLHLGEKGALPGGILLKNKDFFGDINECHVSVKPEDISNPTISHKQIQNTNLIQSNHNGKTATDIPSRNDTYQSVEYFSYTIK